MKISKHFLLTALLTCSAFAESKFYTDAGVSYTLLKGATYTSGLQPSYALASLVPGAPVPTSIFALLNEDKSQWAPFIAAGYAFSDRVGVRISYHYLGRLTANSKSTLLVGGDVVLGDVSLRFNDTVHLFSLSPEFSFPVLGKLTLTFSPELNWVASRGEVLASTLNPVINVLPSRVRNEQGFSFGASVGARWSLTEQCDFTVGYKYTDLKPSWGRQAHLLSGGLHFKF